MTLVAGTRLGHYAVVPIVLVQNWTAELQK
jgi:hypothetical protein